MALDNLQNVTAPRGDIKMNKIKIGYGLDPFSQATVKYEIIAETTHGCYVVRKPGHSLMLIAKAEISDIQWEEKNARRSKALSGQW